jgi:hypothetical protein
MTSPFPGMDPYLEDPALWQDVHHWLISASASQLQHQLNPRGYFAAVESRIWVEDQHHSLYPDVSVLRSRPESRSGEPGILVAEQPVPSHIVWRKVQRREPFLQIFDSASRQLITTIEYISPSNKDRTQARRQYIQKRKEFRQGGVSLVEIDLLRGGRHLVDLPRDLLDGLRAQGCQVINVLRAGSEAGEYYSPSIRQPLPPIGIPLRAGEPDALLRMQSALDRAYQEGAYGLRIDYTRQPIPHLVPADASWADELLVQAGLRPANP